MHDNDSISGKATGELKSLPVSINSIKAEFLTFHDGGRYHIETRFAEQINGLVSI